MKTRNLFLWLFILLTTTAMITKGQTISVSVPSMISEYPLTDMTDKVINVRAGTTIRLVANPVSSQTQWSSNNASIIATPILNPAGNTMDIIVPSVFVNGDEFQVNVFFAVNMTQYYVKFIVNNNPVPGLLTIQQNIQDCPGVDFSFTATTPFQTNHTYTWQEWNGAAWGSLTPSSYYSSLNHALNIQTHSSNQGKRFRAIVGNDESLGSIDTTAEVVVQTVYALPQIQTFTTNTTKYCTGSSVPSVHLNSSETNFIHQLQIWGTSTNVGAPVIGTGGPIDIPWPAGEYQLLIKNPVTGCAIKL